MMVNGTAQWVRLCGRDRRAPVLLWIQGGPGLPGIAERKSLQRRLRLEDDFVVAYWDQRGAGKSFSRSLAPESMTYDQLVEDARMVADALRKRFPKQPLLVTGFSIGGTIALLTGWRYPDAADAVIANGPDIAWGSAEHTAYDFAVHEAVSRKNGRAQRELRKLGRPPHTTPAAFRAKAKWIANFGGMHRAWTMRSLQREILGQLLRAPEYSPSDIARSIAGMQFSLTHLLNEVGNRDLARDIAQLGAPFWLLQGRYDRVAPAAIAEVFFEGLAAPAGKHVVWFEKSAHMPHYEEPEKFRSTLLHIAAHAVRCS